jgi:iron complex transport system ATP-binding protein
MPTPSAPSGVQVTALTVRRAGCPVVDNLSFQAAPGTVTALIGPNGAGKSTALKAILGLLPASGEVVVGGRNLATLTPRERARELGYVPQRSGINVAMSARNVVAQARFAHQGALARLGTADAAAIDQALVRTDAAQFAERPFTQLSAGEQQRVLLARALAAGAGAILLDEPTAALDVGHALALLDLLRELAGEGRTVVVVLHDLDQVARIADQVVLLDRGQTCARGTPGEVLTAAALQPVFGVVPVPAGAWGFARA